MGLEAISTEPIIQKLRTLREYLPNEDDTLYQLGEFLADRLSSHPKILPIGLNMVAELGFYDLQMGVNGYTKEPIRSGLIGYPPQLYAVLKMRVQDLVDATCPEDFSKQFKDVQEKVRRMVK